MLSCRKQSRKITNFCLKQGQCSRASAHTFTQTFLDCLLRCKCSSNVNPGSVKSYCMLVMLWYLNIYKKFSSAKQLSLNLCLFTVLCILQTDFLELLFQFNFMISCTYDATSRKMF